MSGVAPNGDQVAASTLLALLDGAVFANATRRSGKPCRIRLPGDPAARGALVTAHLRGVPATVTFHADGHEPWREQVEAVVLAAFCPATDGPCRWVAIDLDGADHGNGGLVDPVHATRTLAEQAGNAGLLPGLLVARSRRGRGRHVFLLLSEPVSLPDAVVGVAALAAAAFRVAASDVTECGAKHAFRRTDGAIVRPGDPGAVELLPHSTARPTHGWALTLPGAGAFAPHGGGVIVDAFTDRPVVHNRVPRCDRLAWSQCLEHAKASLAERTNLPSAACLPRGSNRAKRTLPPIDRVDARTRAFLDGRTPKGSRNSAAFAASANLLGCGVPENEAERLILAGASACGLPECEALATFKSAVRALVSKHRCL